MGIDLAQSVLLILAGGKGSRFGEPKGRQPVGGQPLLAWQAERFKAAGGGPVLVVFGHHVLETALPFVVNPVPERGPYSSLQCGLKAATPGPDGVLFVLPVDVPAPRESVWRGLAAVDALLDAVVPTYEGRGGHPVRLSQRLAVQLREIPWDAPDARLDLQLRALGAERLSRHPVDDATIRMNLNTFEAFRAWECTLDKTAPGSR